MPPKGHDKTRAPQHSRAVQPATSGVWAHRIAAQSRADPAPQPPVGAIVLRDFRGCWRSRPAPAALSRRRSGRCGSRRACRTACSARRTRKCAACTSIAASTAWALERCHVLEVSSLLRELIRSFSEVPVEYAEDGPHGRLAQVVLDQLAAAPQVDLMLPLPQDPRLRQIYRSLEPAPGAADHAGPLEREARASAKKPSAACFCSDTGLTFRAWRQRLRLLERPARRWSKANG